MGSDEQFGDLDRVEGGALPQVVVADEQCQPPTVGDAFVLTDPSDVARVLTGRVEWRRDVGDDDAGDDDPGERGS